MGIRNFQVITIGTGTGVITANISATAAKIAIPTTEGGSAPKYVALQAFGGTAANIITVMPTVDAVGDATKGFPLVVNHPTALILNVHGYSHIGVDALVGTNSSLYIAPLEDF